MSFIIKLTAVGAAKIAAAAAGGPVVSLTQIAVGDGGGNPVSPPGDPAPSAMVREVYRTNINSLYVNPTDATIMMAELVIPSGTGGFAIREIGVFDGAGALIAYGNFPETYKPSVVESATCDMDVFVAIKVGSSSNVQLVIDTSIVVATRPWVIATITAAYLIPGGLTGQVLSKASNAAGDFAWINPSAAINIVVDVVQEMQTATAGQTVFTLATLTTEGVAAYIEGSRAFNYTVLNGTQVQFDTGIAAGTKVWFLQNEPTEPINIRRLIVSRAFFMGC